MEQNNQTTQVKPRNNFPTGLIVVLCYLGYSFVTQLWGIKINYMFIGPLVLGEGITITYKILSIGVIIYCFVGLLRKRDLGWKVSVYWFSFGIAFSATNLLLTLASFQKTVEHYAGLLPKENPMSTEMTVLFTAILGIVFTAVVNGFILRYLFKQKELFEVSAP